MTKCTNFRRLRRANLCSLFVKNLTVSTQKLKTRLIASPMSRPKEGRPIDKRKEYLVRGVELLGTVPQKPNCNQNCGDNIETGTSKKTPVAGIVPCHPSYDCGGDAIQQCGNDTNNSNENHSLLLSSWNETTAILACPCPVLFSLGASALTPRVQHLAAVETPVFTIIATYLAGIFVAIAVREFFSNFKYSHAVLLSRAGG